MNIKRNLLFLFCLISTSLFADGNHKIFNLGDFQLESGATLTNAQLSYVTHGKLNEEKDNLIVVPSAYLGDHHGFDFLIKKGMALDPEKFFIVATDMFQNGLSSSPSNTPAPLNGPNFPLISIRDNVKAGYRLVTEMFGVEEIHAVVGFSMGAQQAFQWGVSYPDFVHSIVGIAGSAVEYPHGKIRLEGFISAIKADSAFMEGNYKQPPEVGLRAGGAHWASWGWSQEWFRQELYKEMGLNSAEEVIDWFEERVLTWDANDLIALARTWQNNNIGNSPGFNGNATAALNSIKARVLYMPSETDMYFHIDALKAEAEKIPRVELRIIPTLWGHIAGAGFDSNDLNFMNDEIIKFFHNDSAD